MRFGMVELETGIPCVSALTFRYLCWYENRLRFGIAKSETRFPFVSALTFRYLCIKCRAVSWYNCGNFLYDRDCLCKKIGSVSMSVSWNLWHGCHKISEGCRHCYVYRQDSRYDKDSSVVTRTAAFDLPLRCKRNGDFRIPSGEMVYTCFTSDFFLEEADEWRAEAWAIIRERCDLSFLIPTKRIDRFRVSLPSDWGDGYDHVAIACTVENQDRANYRLPLFRSLPIRHKLLFCAPLLGALDLSGYLDDDIEEVSVGGESGMDARVCDYDWVLDIRRQCIAADIPFSFHQTGARLRKGGKVYRIRREFQHSQARRAGINYKIDR